MIVHGKDGSDWKFYYGVTRIDWDNSRKELTVYNRFGQATTVGLAEAGLIELSVENGGQRGERSISPCAIPPERV
jgi:hypothetical protein